VTLSRSRKLALTILLFAAGAGLVFAAGAVHGVGPLFAAWIPLLAVPWLLTRPEPDGMMEPAAPAENEPADSDSPANPRG
jgi:hypothetical protein